jgi:hypothetical protein
LEQELEIATFCKFTECSKKRQDDTRQTQNSEICHGENFANSIFSQGSMTETSMKHGFSVTIDKKFFLHSNFTAILAPDKANFFII